MERRSNRRQRKAVDYKQILDGDPEESDDDFAAPPPSKRPKESVSAKLLNDRPPEHQTDESKAKRLSREEKMNNRALEQALQASQTYVSDPVKPIQLKVSGIKETSTRRRDDEFLPDNEESEEESVSSEDSDSDFNSSSPITTKSKKKQKTNRKAIKAKSPVHKNCQKPVQKSSKVLNGGPQASDSLSTLAPGPQVTLESNPQTIQESAITETLSNVSERVTKKEVLPLSPKCPCPPKASLSQTTPTISRACPKWTPPSRAGEGRGLTQSPMTMNTSNMPVIRVGLSRHARVKPLHGNRT